MADDILTAREGFDLRRLYRLFTRIVSLFFIALAVQYWLKAIGFPDSNIRFDTMSSHWQVAVAFLAVVQPIASLGLWGNFKWGLVVWAIVAGVELLMYSFYSEYFGANIPILVFHLASLTTFVLYFFAIRFEAHRIRQKSG